MKRYLFGAAVVAPLSIIGLLALFTPGPAAAINVNVSAQVGTVAPPGGGGGGGGGGGTPPSDPALLPKTQVNFIGRAYPLSRISLLQNGVSKLQTISGPDASFSMSLSAITPGSYNFLIIAQDPSDRQSSFSIPIVVTRGATTTVSGIFIAPTIGLNKPQVRQGDNLVIFGRSVPQGDVTISVNSAKENFLRTKADGTGAYLYTFDTSVLEMGAHSAKAKTLFGNQGTDYTAPVSFSVVSGTVPPAVPPLCPKADLTADCRINLADFSVMAYWYKRAAPPAKVDLKADKKIDLADFAILAAQWTG